MSREEALAKVGRLKAVTVERGATPAEAATAASLALRLLSQIGHHGDFHITAYAARHAPACASRSCRNAASRHRIASVHRSSNRIRRDLSLR